MLRPLVLHMDMDAFFASVEVRSDPRLAGLPLAVGGGPGKRRVVTTASYPARVFGIRSGMAMAEALRLCPHLFVLAVDPPKYVHESLEVLAVLDRFSPRVEPASIDEAYLSFPPVREDAWQEEAIRTGTAVRRAIQTERGLSCTVGLATNKLQAKMASSLAKPGGVREIPAHQFLDIFGDRPVSDIPGVGPRTTEVLARIGIVTVSHLAKADPGRLRAGFGQWAVQLSASARGEDLREVIAAGEEPLAKSAGHEMTFAEDVGSAPFLRATTWLLADRVARRLRRHRYLACTGAVRFKVKQQRFSRQRVLDEPTDDARILALTAWELLEEARQGRALRLLGVAGMALVSGEAVPELLIEDRRRRDLIRAGDRIRNRFGEGLLLPAGVFLREESEP